MVTSLIANRIGLALGGGSARGLAHVPMLEVLDEFGIKPSLIVGCSFGALVGAAYAGGMSGKEIRAHAENLLANPLVFGRQVFGKRRIGLTSLFSLKSISSLHLDGERLADAALPDWLPANIEDLKTPLRVMTTDYESMSEHLISKGPVLEAVGASIAIPGVIASPRIGGRLHVDGGITNPVPFDHAREGCDFVIAIDVTGKPNVVDGSEPSNLAMAVGSLLIMFNKVAELKRQSHPPEVYMQPNVDSVGAADFFKVKEIFAAMTPEQDRFRRMLDATLSKRANAGP